MSACLNRLYRTSRGLSESPKPRKSSATVSRGPSAASTPRQSNELDGKPCRKTSNGPDSDEVRRTKI
jgi:hypothetical protein